eukprot:1356694-Prymnesium_polylepis.1
MSDRWGTVGSQAFQSNANRRQSHANLAQTAGGRRGTVINLAAASGRRGSVVNPAAASGRRGTAFNLAADSSQGPAVAHPAPVERRSMGHSDRMSESRKTSVKSAMAELSKKIEASMQ